MSSLIKADNILEDYEKHDPKTVYDTFCKFVYSTEKYDISKQKAIDLVESIENYQGYQ